MSRAALILVRWSILFRSRALSIPGSARTTLTRSSNIWTFDILPKKWERKRRRCQPRRQLTALENAKGLGPKSRARTKTMNDYERRGDRIREDAKALIYEFMRATDLCQSNQAGMTQAQIFKRCGFDWGNQPKNTSSNQQYWVA